MLFEPECIQGVYIDSSAAGNYQALISFNSAQTYRLPF